MMSANGFTICHPELSSLTLESGCLDVNLVVPRLKNLTIKYWPAKFLISAPDLFSLRYRDEYDFLELSADFLHLEKVDICICCSSKDKKDARKIICLLQQLHSVKSLTLNSESIKVLSSYTKLISHQPSPFTKLNGLKIYPRYVDEKQSEFTLATEVKKYLLDSSPDATFTMVSHEEIIAVKNVTIARKLMIKLGAALDKLKENSETNTSDMDQDEAPSESHIATVEEQVEDLNEVVMTGTSRITEILQEIEETLTKLPKSHRDKLQARFYCLCAEADTVMRPIV
ncbi:hypothetical protein QVD17_04190 [Tagetes erecta]|uniref:Uncharacterized protein n=1 Tax=Tagetes erecta TaxID=13708 RepID=A0AAD8LBG8_TARER|nr:hypothetical protein QVD17_04190 [Tagetes erecta]